MFFAVIFVLIWAGSLAAWVVVSRAFRSADVDKMKNRILDNPKEPKPEKKAKAVQSLIRGEDASAGDIVRKLLLALNLQDRLQTLLEQAGLRWKPVHIAQATAAAFGAGFVLANIARAPGLGAQLGAAVVASLMPLLYVVRARSSRMGKFEEQFPESLEFVSRSMRAGHAFSVSLEMIHREFGEPLGAEFRRTFDEHNLGLPLETALLKLAKRIPLLDVHFFVSAVLLQKRTGGNLAEILDKLAHLMRERFKLRGKIKAISAHGRMTGMALTGIPVGVALLMFYVNPNYASFFIDDEVGNMMLGAALALQVAGYVVIQKIVTIEV